MAGVALGISGYRKASRLGRMLTADTPAGSGSQARITAGLGQGPATQVRGAAGLARNKTSADLSASSLSREAVSQLRNAAVFARQAARLARDAGRFARDVADGMAEYHDLHSGQLGHRLKDQRHRSHSRASQRGSF